jgi:pimeloyl-ACP methyl ester carboxylesterase
MPGDAANDMILVHGLSMSSRYMMPMARDFAADFHIYAPDLPGFGRSAKPPHVLTIPELAAALAAWMDAVRVERTVLVGNSFGCQIITEFALRHPARAAALIFAGPTVDPRARTRLQQMARALWDVPFEPPSLLPIIVHDYFSAGPRRTLRTLRHLVADRMEAKLPQVRAPTLVTRGEHDPIVPQHWVEEATRLLPQGRLVVLPGAAHAVHYNAPAMLAQIVRNFLQEQKLLPVDGVMHQQQDMKE